MVLAIILVAMPVVQAVPVAMTGVETVGETVSINDHDYAELSGDNYANLNYFASVTLTGNMATDIANIANAQVGKMYGDLGYDEIGATAWCARFVSDCARIAGVPLSTIGKTAGASPSGFGLTDSQLIDKSTAKKGDLVFWKCSKLKQINFDGTKNDWYNINAPT